MKAKSVKSKNVKIRLTTDHGKRIYLTIDYFKIGGCKPRKYVDSYYLTENAHYATPVSLREAKSWMREAKCIASWDGDVIEKGEYIYNGKPTTLSALGLRKTSKKSV